MFPLQPFPTVNEIAFFGLVLGRMAGLFSAIPVFGSRRVPNNIKMVVILMMTLLCFPLLKGKIPTLPTDSISLFLLVIRETLVGLSLGLLSQVIFAAVDFCGQIVGMQMGLSIAAEFDPSQGRQTSVLAIFQGLLAILLFLSLGVHHLFLRAIFESYEVIPVGAWHMSGGLMKFFIVTTSDVFILAVKLASPVMVALLATSVVLGIMARSFPQMNVFFVSMPLNIGIGFLVLGLSLLVFLHILQNSFGGLNEQMKTLFKLIAQG